MGITPLILAPGNYFIGSASGTGSGASGEGYGSTATETFLGGTAYVNGWFTGSFTTFQGVGVNVTLSNQSGAAGKWPTALFDTNPAPSSTPEPGSLGLFSLGLIGLVASRGFRRMA